MGFTVVQYDRNSLTFQSNLLPVCSDLLPHPSVPPTPKSEAADPTNTHLTYTKLHGVKYHNTVIFRTLAVNLPTHTEQNLP